MATTTEPQLDVFTQLSRAIATAEALLAGGSITADQRKRLQLLSSGLEPWRRSAFVLRDLVPKVAEQPK